MTDGRPQPRLVDRRQAIPYQDEWNQRGFLRREPLGPLPEKLRRCPGRRYASTADGSCTYERASPVKGFAAEGLDANDSGPPLARQVSAPTWLPQDWTASTTVAAASPTSAPSRGGSASSARRGAGGRLAAPSWLSCLCAAEPARADNQGRGTAAPQSLGEALRARLRRCLPWASSSEGPAAADPLVRPVQRRWYRLHPLAADITFFVRPDAGLRGRQPGFTASLQRALAVSHYAMAASAEEAGIFQKKLERKGDVRTLESRWKGGLGGRKKLQLSWSVPNFVERRWMLEAPPGFQCDVFRNVCRICYEQPAELILLPCRHGGLCEECLRLTFLSRPKHRGGHNCPFCRRRSTEVLQIYRDSYGPPQYAFAIQMM